MIKVHLVASVKNKDLCVYLTKLLCTEGFQVRYRWWELERTDSLSLVVEKKDSIRDCDVVVFLPPGSRSARTVLQYACALKKPILAWGESDSSCSTDLPMEWVTTENELVLELFNFKNNSFSVVTHAIGKSVGQLESLSPQARIGFFKAQAY